MGENPPLWCESWSEADPLFDQFMESLPVRRDQLRQMVASTGGPNLDGSLDSLGPLNQWYVDTALRGETDGMDWFPVWLKQADFSSHPAFEDYVHPISDDLLRLWELVAVYVGDVLVPHLPHARWVCLRSDDRESFDNGRPMIDQGLVSLPVNPMMVTNVAKIRVSRLSGLRYGNFFGAKTDEIPQRATLYIEKDHFATSTKVRRWQKAPTGPDAYQRIEEPTW